MVVGLQLMTVFFAVLFLCGQAALEAKYKEELDEAFGIKFNNLFTITNMPIKVNDLLYCFT